MSLRIRSSEIAFHLQNLADSADAWEAVQKGDVSAFRKVCQTLKVPKKYFDSLVKIVLSAEPEDWPDWP